jgi:ubiquinol-cytochrome c reductase cytochrome c subunit
MAMKRLLVSSALVLAACGGASSHQPAASSAAPAATFAAQVERGGELYGEHCASCHGDAGQGGPKAPTLFL